MSKRQPLDKAASRARRNRMLAAAAEGKLPVTDGVREMRAISGLSQEAFARHREVSARVVKAIELDQANPTVATLNRIAGFFGLEVGFIPTRRQASDQDKRTGSAHPSDTVSSSPNRAIHAFALHMARSMIKEVDKFKAQSDNAMHDVHAQGEASRSWEGTTDSWEDIMRSFDDAEREWRARPSPPAPSNDTRAEAPPRSKPRKT